MDFLKTSFVVLALAGSAAFGQNVQSADALIQQGITLMRSGDLDGAAKVLQQAVQADPSSVLAHYNLAILLEHRGDLPHAIEQLQQDLRIDRDDPAAHIHLSEDLFAVGRPREALATLQDADMSAPEAAENRYGTVGRWLLEHRRPAESIAVLQTGLGRVPSSPSLNLLLGVAEGDLHGASAARPYIDKALEIDPKIALGYNLRGNLWMRLGNYQEAVTNYRRAAELAPATDLYWYDVALALERMNQLSEAIACAEKAVALEPAHGSTHYLLGKLYAKTNRNVEAIRELQRTVELDPQANASYYLLARTYAKLGNKLKAQEWDDKLVQLKLVHDEHAGLGGPATESASLLDTPGATDKHH